MKRKHLSTLKLNKKSISNLRENITGGYNANTCQGPCQGGTSCCSVGGLACEDADEKDPIRIPVTTFNSILNCSLFC
ncbi:hypothetical protein [Kordia sp.]|uniref:hypothetical protein n=1 Tax=Kordia sp. TaxID=1965332 RepID=UPI003D6B1EE3